MSRIKGTQNLLFQDYIVVRYLDTVTGKTYLEAVGGTEMLGGFVKRGNVWEKDRYTFTPDAVPELAVDWYVMRMDPTPRATSFKNAKASYVTFGPYTEEKARAEAVWRASTFNTTWAVLKLQVGNTVAVQPPAPPAAVVHWS